jgi:hypothetical protein
VDAALNLNLYAMHCWRHVKLRDRDFPQDYAGQFAWPFRWAQSVEPSAAVAGAATRDQSPSR